MAGTRGGLVVGGHFSDQYDKPAGKLQSVTGRIELIRGGLTSPGCPAGSLVCEGDVIKTGVDGSAAVLFVDGTTFHLGPNSCVVIDAFDPAETSPSRSSLRVVRGEVGFFPGRKIREGHLSIETPSAAIRGTGAAALASGLAALFILCLVEEANAASEEIVIFDFDDVTVKDLQHGTFEVVTKGQNPQVFIVDDPGHTLVLHPRGSGFSIEVVANTRAQMLDLQSAYKSAFDIYSRGSQDPFFQLFQRTAGGLGSGDSVDLNQFLANKFVTLLNIGPQNSPVPPPFIPPVNAKSADAGAPPLPVTGLPTVTILPISRFQIGEVKFSPNIIPHVANPTYESLVSVTISNIPAGYSFRVGTETTLRTGTTLTFTATELSTGIDVITPASGVTETHLDVYVTVLGLGGLRNSQVVALPLTLDQDPTGKVEWQGGVGNWQDASKWSTGFEPLPTQDAVISTGDVTSSTPVALNSLRLNPGVTLEVAGSSFTINAADADPLSNNGGTIKVDSGASFSVGNDAHAGQLVVNAGTIDAAGGSITFISANVSNSGTMEVIDGSITLISTNVTNHDGANPGFIRIDAPTLPMSAVLELQNSTIDSGDLINHGLIKVTSGASNSIHDVVNFSNDGTLQVTGNGTVLLLSNETLSNAGGHIQVDGNATLNLTNVTIAGGELTGSGQIDVASNGTTTTLDGSTEAVTIDTGTAVTLQTGTTLKLDGTIQGGGEISIAGASAIVADGTIGVPINAALLANNLLLTLSGTANLTLTQLQGDLTATSLSGTLNVTTADNTADNTISITTGSGATTITGTAAGTVDTVTVNASLMGAARTLALHGDDNFTVTGLVGDLTDDGAGTLNVTTADNTVDDTISITTGSGATTITGTAAGTVDTVTVNASSMGAAGTLTLHGGDNFVVTGLVGDLTDNGAGTLNVTTADNTADDTISITTGSGAATITGTAGTTLDTVTVNASSMGAAKTLALHGGDNFVVTGLVGDLTDDGAGTLNVTTADNTADDAISITIGSGATTITGTAGTTLDTVTVNAAALLAANSLTLHGGDNFTVTGLVGDLTDDGAGTLNVTTADNTADDTISITTGSGATTITGTAAGTTDTVTVNAAALLATNSLALHGGDNFTVTGLVGDLTDDGAGTLNVTTADNTVDDTISITTGSGATTITGTAAGTTDTVTVNAAALLATNSLALHGGDNFTVTGLVGDLTDDGAGTLNVTTADNTLDNTISITTGSGATTVTGTAAGTTDTVTVNASSMGAANSLALHGGDNFTVTGLVGDLTNDGAGTLNVTTADNTADNTISITTGSGATIITGTAAGTTDTVTVNASLMGAARTLTLHGGDNFVVTGLVGDLTDDGAGTLNVTTADNTADNTISITTGSGATTITGTAAGTVDTVTVNAAALLATNSLALHGGDNFTVTGLVGDITDDGAGTLNVTTADNTADNTISITTGTGAATITGTAAGTTDTVMVNAAALEAANSLALHGGDNFTVTGMVGDLTDDGAGTLNVTTADNTADNTISIATGSGATTITGTAAGTVDTVTVNASLMGAARTLALHGGDNFVVTGLVGDLTDDGAGTLNVTTADNTADNTISITTGSGATIITGTAAGTLDTVTVNAAALLATNSLALHGGDNFTVSGLVGDLTDDGAGTLNVTTADNTLDNTISITTGSGATTITGTAAGTTDTVTLDASLMGAANSLALHGDDNFTVTGLVGDLTNDGAGTLNVTTADNTADNTIAITTGSGATIITGTAAGTTDTVTVNAAALLATNSLALHGGDNFTVTGLVGDLTDDGAGTLNVTTADNTVDDTISITTGSGAAIITGTAAGTVDTVTINASSMGATKALTLHGDDNFVVTGLVGDLTDDGAGALTVTTADNAADNTISITTGSGAATITGTAAGTVDTVTVNASSMGAAKTLALHGGDNFVVTGLVGDLTDDGAGTLNVTTADNTLDNTISITTGSGATTITGTAAGTTDTVTVDASSMGAARTLALHGDDNFTVTGLVGDLTNDGAGTLNVTTADNTADNTISITTGSGATTVTGTAAGTTDTVTVNAAALLATNSLALHGGDNFTVTGLIGDLTDDGAGTLNVTTADNTADNTISITTGSGATTITGTAAGTTDTVMVNAAALLATNSLALHGGDNFVVNGLVGDLTDDGASTLNVTTADNTADDTISITTGSGAATITGTAAGTTDTVTVNASLMGAANSLALHGDDNFTVTGLVGDLTDDGAGTLNVTTADNTADDTISITTGSGATTITGTAAVTLDTVTINAAALLATNSLALHGGDNFTVTGLIGDLTDDGAGTLNVTTADNTADNTISITTGSGATTITGTAAGTTDTVMVNAAALLATNSLALHGGDNFVVNGLVGDLTDDGASTLNVTTADNTADDTISITTGSGAATITGTAAGTTDTVTVNASLMGAANSLALHGDDNFTVTGLVGDLTDDGAGTLNVTTADNTADDAISITTGSGATTVTGTAAGTTDTVTVDASLMGAARTLALHGDDNFVVTGLVGDLTDDGAGTLNVTTADNTADNTISITTGSGATTITGTAAGTVDTVTVNAAALLATNSLALHGGDNFTVTGLVGDITDDGAGTLNVTTADNTADDTISITTGSGATIITGTAAGTLDTVTVNAAALRAANSLALHGGDNFIVTGLVGDLTDDGAGTLNVTTADNTVDNTISITTGSGATTITGTAAGTTDTVTVNASLMGAANSLALHGGDNFTVTGLVGDLTNDGAGTLNVTTADNTADNTISITTGSGATTITGTAGTTLDTVTVNASSMGAAKTLTLHGGDNFTVTGLVGDLTDDGAGTLNVTTADNTADDAISITTGSGAATITGIAAGTLDTVTVDASLMGAARTLALHGDDNFTVTGLVGDLTDDGAGTLNVTTADNTADNTISITTGSGATTIIGTAAGTLDTVMVNAAALLAANSLTLHGDDNFVVTGLVGDLTDDGAGTLNVTTADNTADNTISITTGSGATTITGTAGSTTDTVTVNASLMGATRTLALHGGDNFTVTGLVGDLTDDGAGTLNVTTADNAADNTISITTGSGATTITGTAAGTTDTVMVNAAAMGAANSLALHGNDNFVVSGLVGDLIDDGAGTLTVTTADNTADDGISITTGSGATTITGTAAGTIDTVTVNAAAMGAANSLALHGGDNFTVTGLVGDLTDDGAGTLNVTTADNTADNTISITTGSGATIITGTAAGTTDTVMVNAAALEAANSLALHGGDNFFVTGLAGDLTDDGAGTLNVTTADNAADDTISITTGSGATTITGTAAGTTDTVTVDASLMDAARTLALHGDDNFTVTGLAGDLTDDGAGTLNVTTADNTADDAISIATGSGATIITGTAGTTVDTVTVNAAALLATNSLDLHGDDNFTVTGLVGDLTDDGAGTLNVTTADNTADNTISITTGSGAATITGIAAGATDTVTVNASSMGAARTLALHGDDNFTVTGLVGDLTDDGAGTLNVTTADNTADDAISITTGSGATTITGTAAGTTDTVTVNAAAMGAANPLALHGDDNFTVTGLVGDLTDDGAGTLNVTTADNTADDTISITTGSGTTAITGTAAGTTDTVTVDASLMGAARTLALHGGDNFAVSGLVGDLTDDGAGTLTVTTADNAADNTISITTGSGATIITGTAGTTVDTVTVNAAALLATNSLDLHGGDNFTVTGLVGDLTDDGAGTLNVTTADNTADNTISITTGSGATTITGTAAGTIDTVAVNAAAMGAANSLALHGDDSFVVTGLVGDLTDDGAGTLNVTTADNTADNTISITTGTGAATITGTAAGTTDTVTVDASLMDAARTLALHGGDNFVVSGLVGDLTDNGAGTLNVTTADNTADDTISITTGSGATTITGTAAGTTDTVTVNASSMGAASSLALHGGDNFTVTHLTASLTDDGDGDLNVTTDDVASLTITTTGSGANTINAQALTSGHTLTLEGDAAASITLTDGNLDASSYQGNLTVTGGSGSNTLTGGAGADMLTGGTGNDTFVFKTLANSLVSTFDTITDFTSGSDTFAIAHALAGFDSVSTGGTGDLAQDLAGVLDSTKLAVNGAAEVQITSGADAGFYVVISGNAAAGYHSATDAVIKLQNGTTVHASDFVVA